MSRLKPSNAIDDYMPVIREELTKADQSQGLILLALYCLDNTDRLQNFLPLYWTHLSSPASTHPHLMASLKAMTDFAIRLDLTSISLSEDCSFTYSLFLSRVMELMLTERSSLRIMAIESLCRLLYHNRVGEDLRVNCLVRLLFLWWETSTE